MQHCPLTVRPGQVVGWRPARSYEQPGMHPIYAIGGGSAPLPGGDPAPQPAPGAPVPPVPAPAPQPAPAPAPPPPAPAPAPSATPKIEDLLTGLSDADRKIVLDAIKRGNDEAARYRTERTTAQQQAQAAQQQRDAVLKALGLNADGTENVDPVQAAEEARNEAWVAQVQLEVFKAAGRSGADPSKLLDSVSFIDSLDQHVTVQPGDPQFAAQLDAAIKAAVDANPSYKAGPAVPVPPASGAPLPPAPGERPTRPTSIADALRKRREQNT